MSGGVPAATAVGYFWKKTSHPYALRLETEVRVCLAELLQHFGKDCSVGAGQTVPQSHGIFTFDQSCSRPGSVLRLAPRQRALLGDWRLSCWRFACWRRRAATGAEQHGQHHQKGETKGQFTHCTFSFASTGKTRIHCMLKSADKLAASQPKQTRPSHIMATPILARPDGTALRSVAQHRCTHQECARRQPSPSLAPSPPGVAQSWSAAVAPMSWAGCRRNRARPHPPAHYAPRLLHRLHRPNRHQIVDGKDGGRRFRQR
jgi:hypothetical protein